MFNKLLYFYFKKLKLPKFSEKKKKKLYQKEFNIHYLKIEMLVKN